MPDTSPIDTATRTLAKWFSSVRLENAIRLHRDFLRDNPFLHDFSIGTPVETFKYFLSVAEVATVFCGL
jgi:hypothetical protein